MSILKKESGKWGNLSRHGEISSTQGKGWMDRSIANALGEDEADVVISHEPVYQKNDNFSEVEEGITPISSSEIEGKRNSANAGHYVEHEFLKEREGLFSVLSWSKTQGSI